MSDEQRSTPPEAVCGEYVGDNDATCWRLACIRPKGHAGPHDNVRGDEPTQPEAASACVFCGQASEGNYSIHRDGFCVGPDVPLCDGCGSKPEPTEEEIWRRIRERRFAAGERLCIGCGKKTAETFGGLCIDCDAKEDETHA